MENNNSKVADIEALKLLAEQLIAHKQEIKELNAQIKALVAGTEIEFHEPLANGGFVAYELIAPKPKLNYQNYSNYLITLLSRGEKLSVEEVEAVMRNFVETKDPKWKLTIKK